VKISDFGCSR